VEGAKGLEEPFCKNHYLYLAFWVLLSCFLFIIGIKFIEVYNEINSLSLFIFNTYSISSRYIRSYSTKLPKPIKIYENSDIQKLHILEENKGKFGVYLLRNLKNKKIYVGSSIDLRRRFKEYFNIDRLLRHKNLPICAALIKYGYSQFSLEILEYCDTSVLLKKKNNII